MHYFKFLLLMCLLFGTNLSMVAQDEYKNNSSNDNPFKTKKEEDQIRDRSDSIQVINEAPPKETIPDMKLGSTVKQKSQFMENLRVGGGFDLYSFYDNTTALQMLYLKINPQITSVLSKHFEGGLQMGYTYYGTFGTVNNHFYSAGPILRAYPASNLFLQVEADAYYTIRSYTQYNYNTKNIDFNVFVGGGMVSRINARSYILTGIKVNLMKNALTYNQIYPYPFVSYHFGL